jgi:hypothetical protein
MNMNHSTDTVYLDIAKAFDTGPHGHLFDALHGIGISGTVGRWVRGFLSHRSQVVFVNGCRSDSVSVSSGVPQGSVLGPLLFIIFFAQIDVSGECGMLRFADDTKLFDVSPDCLQRAVNCFSEAASYFGFSLAPHKSAVVTFSTQLHEGHQYFLQDVPIPAVDRQRDLGITLDSKLTFSAHCQEISNRAASLCFRIRTCFSCRNPVFIFSVFCTYVRPILERDSQVWSPYFKKRYFDCGTASKTFYQISTRSGKSAVFGSAKAFKC